MAKRKRKDLRQRIEEFRKYLETGEFRVTPQRLLVLEEIITSPKHVDAEELATNLRRKGLKVSRATVYRTLDLLVESGLIQRVAVGLDERARYEHMMGRQHHDHLVCLQCGRVIEFRNDHIEKLQEEVCSHYGFRMDSHSHRIFGRCKQCQRAGTSAEAHRVARRIL